MPDGIGVGLSVPDIAALRARLEPGPITRFAPSPTGYLHLGHVVNAIYVWGVARALGGRVLLRIEDHDRVRSRPEYERALLEDLEWLGFVADMGPVRQRDEPEAYESARARLQAANHIYACDCSRKTMTPHNGGDDSNEESLYSGRCRTRGLPLADRCGIRVEIEPGVETFEDGLLGPQAQDPARQCGDLLLRDRDHHWTYQFAVTVDDIRQGIDLVIRGADLLASTGRQIRLARMLGRATPPVFLHHPILLKPSGDKLSKANRDTGVRDLRGAGTAAAEVIGRAAAAAGLVEQQEQPRAMTVTDIVELFRIGSL